MKRDYSDSEKEDDFSAASPESSTDNKSSRKRRRGMIEKKRRDRINQSLLELRRLVPTAGDRDAGGSSSKLEKAEILQMTVDHLTHLSHKGLNSADPPDPQSVACDYREVGFRECVSEVMKYLLTVEGVDFQDPLRMRLLGHLQSQVRHRDVPAAPRPWGPSGGLGGQPPAPQLDFGAPLTPLTPPLAMAQPPLLPPADLNQKLASGLLQPDHNQKLTAALLQTDHSQKLTSLLQPDHGHKLLTSLNNNNNNTQAQQPRLDLPHLSSTPPVPLPTGPATAFTAVSQGTMNHQQGPPGFGFSSFPAFADGLGNYQPMYQGSPGNNAQSQSKPYRPWGPEMAY